MKRFVPVNTVSAAGNLNRRLGIGALVGLLHVGVIYAIVTGLAFSRSFELPNILQAQVFRDVSKPTPPIAPLETPRLVRPQVPVVRAPAIIIASPDKSRRNSITVLQGIRPTGPETIAPIHTSPQPAPSKLPSLPARALAGTHTIPPYPELSRRLGEQGSVILTISVDASGKVHDVFVRNSSGYPRLDEAALNWVKTHWLYRPATHDGAAVNSVVSAKIVFDLRNA